MAHIENSTYAVATAERYQKIIAQYGIRYRYDTEQQRKITTVELVVDERP